MTRSGIFFDARYIRVDFPDGISRFSVGLCTALAKLTDLTLVISDERQLELLPRGLATVKVNAPTSPLEPLVALRLNRAGANLVFSPMQTIGSFGRKFKLIVTLHDLIYYRHPSPPTGFNVVIRLLWRLYHLSFWPQRWLLNRADAVATVSKTTARLIRQHDLTKKPVEVVYNAAVAADEQARLPTPTKRPAEPQRLIYMGSFMAYKNVETLVRGMSRLPDYELHLLSKISDARKTELIAVNPSAKLFFHNGVSDLEYEELLNGSVALVSASLDEGFGIPIIEAASRGIPTVLSDLEIFREIGADASCYFSAKDPDAFAEAVMKLASNQSWMSYSAAARKNASRFNWDSSAHQLWLLIQKFL